MLRRRRALCRKIAQHTNYIPVASDDPTVQERVPMHWILTPKLVEEWIGIRQHVRVEQTNQAQFRVSVVSLSRDTEFSHYFGRIFEEVSGIEFRRRWTSFSLIASTLATRSRSISEDNSATLGASKMTRRGISIPKVSRNRATSCAPKSECPPSEKKFSSTSTCSNPRTRSSMPATVFSISVRGAV